MATAPKGAVINTIPTISIATRGGNFSLDKIEPSNNELNVITANDVKKSNIRPHMRKKKADTPAHCRSHQPLKAV